MLKKYTGHLMYYFILFNLMLINPLFEECDGNFFDATYIVIKITIVKETTV